MKIQKCIPVETVVNIPVGSQIPLGGILPISVQPWLLNKPIHAIEVFTQDSLNLSPTDVTIANSQLIGALTLTAYSNGGNEVIKSLPVMNLNRVFLTLSQGVFFPPGGSIRNILEVKGTKIDWNKSYFQLVSGPIGPFVNPFIRSILLMVYYGD